MTSKSSCLRLQSTDIVSTHHLIHLFLFTKEIEIVIDFFLSYAMAPLMFLVCVGDKEGRSEGGVSEEITSQSISFCFFN